MTSIANDDLQLILRETDWAHFREKKIFITGGTGFIGKWLLSALSEANIKLNLNCDVTVLTRNAEIFLTNNPHFRNLRFLKFHYGDIVSFEFTEGKFDYFIHAATDTHQKLIKERPLETFDSIVNGTKRILDFARKSKPMNFLLVSSGGVYGVQPADLSHIKETFSGSHHPYHWQAPYGEGKRAAELLCFMYAREFALNFSIARCFAFVGPYLPIDREYAAGNFIGNILRGEEILIHGDGTPRRSYLYSADLVIWLLRILTQAKTGDIYNVGSDQDVSISELAESLVKAASALGMKSVIKILQKPQSGKLPARYVPNTDLASRQLALKIFTPLDEALVRTLEFHRAFLHN